MSPARRRAVAVVAILLAPSLALAQTASVDQVLAAVAEVVRDRARQVASQAIARNLAENLCTGEVKLPPYLAGQREGEASPAALNLRAGGAEPTGLPDAQGQPSLDSPLVLHLGGDAACRASYLPAKSAAAAPQVAAGKTKIAPCDADDVFVRTCRAALRLDVPLTDPYLLKSLSRDTVEFLMRVAARNLSAPIYEESGLVELGAFIHTVLEKLGQKRPELDDLAAPTLALADRLSAQLPRRTFEELRGSEASGDLEAILRAAVVEPWVRGGCEPAGSCPKEPFLGPAGAEVDCPAYEAGRFERRKVFEALFGTAEPKGSLHAGRNQDCATAFPSAGDKRRQQCQKARLTFNLYGSLVRTRCSALLPEERLRGAFRELGYVVAEQGVYRGALKELGDRAAVEALDAYLDAVQKLKLADLPREELAAGVRLVGLYAAARGAAPEATRSWLQRLVQDLEAEVRSPSEDWHSRLLHGAALGAEHPPASASVAALAAGVKDLLALPMLAVYRKPQQLDALREARARLATSADAAQTTVKHLIEALNREPTAAGSLRDYVAALARFLEDLGDVAAAMGAAVGDERVTASIASGLKVKQTSAASKLLAPERGKVFERAAMAMKQGALALRLAADRDWVGLSIRISDELARVAGAGGNVAELERSLKFIRVLLSMYQAASVEEAKAIFAANLEDAASRERRYGGWTVDVGALLGASWGRQYSRQEVPGQPVVKDDARLYGVLAPVGIQVACRKVGLLAYPVDVGSYLTAAGGTGRDWRDALRPGAALFIRPSASIPLVLGVGADYRFEIGGRDERRLYLAGALELPLFTLH